MNCQQQQAWAAIASRVRRGQPVALALQDCRAAGVPVIAVVRHHLGRPGHPQFGMVQDVSVQYGLHLHPQPHHAPPVSAVAHEPEQENHA